VAAAVTGCLETHGYLVLRPRSRLSSRWGLADLIGIRAGHTIFVLAGAAPGRLSRRTQLFVENIRRSGCEFVIVRDLEDVEALSRTRSVATDTCAAAARRPPGPPPPADPPATITAALGPPPRRPQAAPRRPRR
jgi:hypothetical protein